MSQTKPPLQSGLQVLQGDKGSQTLVKAGLGFQLEELKDLNEAESDSADYVTVKYSVNIRSREGSQSGKKMNTSVYLQSLECI